MCASTLPLSGKNLLVIPFQINPCLDGCFTGDWGEGGLENLRNLSLQLTGQAGLCFMPDMHLLWDTLTVLGQQDYACLQLNKRKGNVDISFLAQGNTVHHCKTHISPGQIILRRRVNAFRDALSIDVISQGSFEIHNLLSNLELSVSLFWFCFICSNYVCGW